MDSQNSPSPDQHSKKKDNDEGATEIHDSVHSTPSAQQSPNKLSKYAIGVAAVFAVLAISFGAYAIISSDTEEEPQDTSSQLEPVETDNETVVESASLNFATTEFAYSLSNDSELARLAEADADERLVAVSSDRQTFYFVEDKETANGGSVPAKLVKLANNERSDIIRLDEDDAQITIGSLSPDDTKISFFKSYNEGFRYALGYIDLLAGEMNEGYQMRLDASTRQPLVSSSVWIDNDTILTTENSCFQCDGPRLSKLHTIDIRTGSIELLADATELKDTNTVMQGLVVSANKETAYLLTDDNQNLGGSFDSVSSSTTTIYAVDTQSGEITEVSEVLGVQVNLLGIASDQERLLVTTAEPNDDTAEPGNFLDNQVINTVSITSGSFSPIPISVSQLDDDFASINGLAFNSASNRLYFSMRSTPNVDDNPNEQRVVLYELAINAGEESGVEILFDMLVDVNERILELNVE